MFFHLERTSSSRKTSTNSDNKIIDRFVNSLLVLVHSSNSLDRVYGKFCFDYSYAQKTILVKIYFLEYTQEDDKKLLFGFTFYLSKLKNVRLDPKGSQLD